MGASLVEMASTPPRRTSSASRCTPRAWAPASAPPRRRCVTNLRVLCHDAVEVLEHYDPERFLSCLQLFFPTLALKSRHPSAASQLAFAQAIRQKLAIGGVFHMATDWENYAEHMLEVMSAAEGCENTSASGNCAPVLTGAR